MPPNTPPTNTPLLKRNSTGLGILWLMVSHVICIPIVFFVSTSLERMLREGDWFGVWLRNGGIHPGAVGMIGFVALFGFGFSQILYATPLYLWFRTRGLNQTALGVLIGAGMSFLLNAGCFGLLFDGVFGRFAG